MMFRNVRWDMLLTMLRCLSLRHARRAPFSTGAMIAIVALGVAVFFSVRLANRAAISGFQMFANSVSGTSDFVLTGPGSRVPMAELPRLRRAMDPLPVALIPVVEGTATIPGTGKVEGGFDAAQVGVLGLDLLAVRNMVYVRPAQSSITTASDDEFARFDSVYITRALADWLEVQKGDKLSVVLGDAPVSLDIGVVLEPSPLLPGSREKRILVDLPALQQLMGTTDHVDRIEIIVPEGQQFEELYGLVEERIAALDPSVWTVLESDYHVKAGQSMTAAFRLNLTILSVLALLVGLYLILQAMEAAVVRRRGEIGIMLSMGFEPGWIRRAWLVESLLLGVAGSAAGLLLGWGLAQGAVRAVVRTVNTLYFSTTVEAAGWDWGEALMVFALGVGACVLAGSIPAHDAATTPPVQVLRRQGRGGGVRLPDHPAFGSLLLVVGVFAARMPAFEIAEGAPFPVGGYVAALCWLAGAAILAGRALVFFPKMMAPLMEHDAAWKLSLSQFRHLTGRHKLTVAGLVVAVGMAAGMETLIHSFDRSVTAWIGQALRADLFVAVKGIENASNRNRISERVWQDLSNDPDVERTDVGHIFRIEFRSVPILIQGMRSEDAWGGAGRIWVDPPSGISGISDVPVDGIPSAVVSESFANRHRMGSGEQFEIQTPMGIRKIRIAGVYADYGNEAGTVLMNGELVSRWFNDRRALNLAATLRPGADADAVRQRWIQKHPGLAVRTNRDLRADVMRIFRQTFAVTHALKAIGVLVAVGGLALA
ncbi:MAG: FtsX-like permease family protein, partial [Pontiella sp.]|nr:FtsX-like permease family protein [Pontiella sp.]